jgi:hypothetical protein
MAVKNITFYSSLKYENILWWKIFVKAKISFSLEFNKIKTICQQYENFNTQFMEQKIWMLGCMPYGKYPMR